MTSVLIYLAIMMAAAVLAYAVTRWQSFTSFGTDPFVAAFVLLPGLTIAFSIAGIVLYRLYTG